MKHAIASRWQPPIGTRQSAREEAAALSLIAVEAGVRDHARWWLLGCVAWLYLPFIFAGPGSDPDSLRELHSGATLLWQHRYVLSRPPGYFPYEAWCGVLYAAGGTLASNLATVAMSLLLLDSFLCICAHYQLHHRYLLTLAMAISPVYWASSTSTIDFIWALGCFLVGFRMLLNRNYFSAAAMLGLAVGIRLSSILLVALLLVEQLLERPRDAQLYMTTALAAGVAAALYLPEFIASGNSLRFLTYYSAPWTFREQLGRFIYKNVYFWGLPASICLLCFAPLVLRELVRGDAGCTPLVILSASIVIMLEALFLKLPVQRAYLLPTLPFILIILGVALRGHPRILLALTILIFSYNFVSVNLARPDTADHATRAVIGPFIEPGYLLSDLAARVASQRAGISPVPNR